MEIITVFSARLYGSRSRKNQKLLEGVRSVVGREPMMIARKIALDLNDKQSAYIARATGQQRGFLQLGTCRNGAGNTVAHKADSACSKPNQIALRHQPNTLKKSDYP